MDNGFDDGCPQIQLKRLSIAEVANPKIKRAADTVATCVYLSVQFLPCCIEACSGSWRFFRRSWSELPSHPRETRTRMHVIGWKLIFSLTAVINCDIWTWLMTRRGGNWRVNNERQLQALAKRVPIFRYQLLNDYRRDWFSAHRCSFGLHNGRCARANAVSVAPGNSSAQNFWKVDH